MLGGTCKPGLQPRLPLRYAIQTGAVSVVVQADKLSLLVSIAFAYFQGASNAQKRRWPCVVGAGNGDRFAVRLGRGQRFMGPGFLCSAILWTRCIPGAPNTGDAASAVLLAVAAHKPMLCRAASMFGKHDAQDLRIDVCHADVGYPGYVGYALLRCSGAYAVAFSQGGALDCHLRR